MQKRYPNLNVEIYDNCVDKLLEHNFTQQQLIANVASTMTPEYCENEGSESGLSLISEDDDYDDDDEEDEKPSAPQSELVEFKHPTIDDYVVGADGNFLREKVSTIQGYPIWECFEDQEGYVFVGYSMGENLILDEKWKGSF